MSTGHASLAYPPSDDDIAAGRETGKPNPAQEAFETQAGDVDVLIAGFGTGKTTAGARKTLTSGIENPGTLALCIAPTYRHSERQHDAMLDLLAQVRHRDGIDLVQRDTQSRGQAELELTNGSRFEFYSARAKVSFYSANATTVWLDELEWADDPEGIYRAVWHRLREKTRPGVATVRRRRVLVTSTAQFWGGILAEKAAEAQRQQNALRAAAATGKPAPDFDARTTCVVAPSTCAIGYGLDLDIIRRWRSEMDRETFRRVVLCKLTPPPEVVLGGYVQDDTADRGGHVVEWSWRPEFATYYGVDWGINAPHWLLAQYVPSLANGRGALVIAEEWGPPPQSSVAQTIDAMAQRARALGLVGKTGRPTGKARFAVIGDPTTNPGQSLRNPDEQHILALEGASALAALGWPYSAPVHPRQRAKHLQIQLLRTLLRPPDGSPPRILFARAITADKDRQNAAKQTRRGIWHACRDGVKYEKDAQGRLRERIQEKGEPGQWVHAFDALAYLAVMVFGREFAALTDLETGLLSGAGAWGRVA